MESTNKYNVINKTITVKDALRAMVDGCMKITFEKLALNNPRPGVTALKPKFEVAGNLVN
jgi:hypothetical protein